MYQHKMPNLTYKYLEEDRKMLKHRLSVIALVLCIVLIAGMVVYTDAEPFKVKLTMFERFIVLGLLPEKATFVTMRIILELQIELAPTNEERLAAGLKDLRTGGVTAELGWDKVEPKEIVFIDIMKEAVVNALEKLDKAEAITAQHMSVYIKFIIGEEKEEIKEGE